MGLLATIRSQLRTVWPAAAPVAGRGGWWPVTVREPYTGAWQQNVEIRADTALSNPVVFRCVSLISTDVAKLRLRLVQIDDDGIWTEATSPAFSPVLRVPNRYQTIQLFLERWMLSKLLWGNTYVLKERDDRNVVTALYVLDPAKVTVMVAPDGSVYYKLNIDDLAGIPQEEIGVPAREIIHDRWNCVFHPLVGVSPLYGCGAAALQGQQIESASTAFFSSGGRPSGMLAPPAGAASVDSETVKRLSDAWHALGPGRTAILSDHLQYTEVGSSAVDAQLTDQYGMTVKTIAGCFGVPISMVDSSQQPPYANSEASTLQYHSQCLQTHLTGIETALDAGLELPTPYGTEFDLDDLLWMDTTTRTKAAHDAISAGAMTPNEARFKYFGLPPVEGGDTCLVQQQYYSLAALAARDAQAPLATPASRVAEPAPPEPSEEVIAATVGDLAKT
ncbi:MAG TPA: phage portal protein [Vicinamibacterales bacterium]|nr:phage portal protein [Vicinamibacterales bacterium]